MMVVLLACFLSVLPDFMWQQNILLKPLFCNRGLSQIFPRWNICIKDGLLWFHAVSSFLVLHVTCKRQRSVVVKFALLTSFSLM